MKLTIQILFLILLSCISCNKKRSKDEYSLIQTALSNSFSEIGKQRATIIKNLVIENCAEASFSPYFSEANRITGPCSKFYSLSNNPNIGESDFNKLFKKYHESIDTINAVSKANKKLAYLDDIYELNDRSDEFYYTLSWILKNDLLKKEIDALLFIFNQYEGCGRWNDYFVYCETLNTSADYSFKPILVNESLRHKYIKTEIESMTHNGKRILFNDIFTGNNIQFNNLETGHYVINGTLFSRRCVGDSAREYGYSFMHEFNISK